MEDMEKKVEEVVRYCKAVVENKNNGKAVQMLAEIIIDVLDGSQQPMEKNCPACNGEGSAVVETHNVGSDYVDRYEDCQVCGGTGWPDLTQRDSTSGVPKKEESEPIKEKSESTEETSTGPWCDEWRHDPHQQDSTKNSPIKEEESKPIKGEKELILKRGHHITMGRQLAGDIVDKETIGPFNGDRIIVIKDPPPVNEGEHVIEDLADECHGDIGLSESSTVGEGQRRSCKNCGWLSPPEKNDSEDIFGRCHWMDTHTPMVNIATDCKGWIDRITWKDPFADIKAQPIKETATEPIKKKSKDPETPPPIAETEEKE